MKRMNTRVLLAILVLAAFVRLLPLIPIHQRNIAAPHLVGGPDSYYHLRRAQLAAAGSDIRFDAWTNYPMGDVVGWPDLYDRALGGVLRTAGVSAVLLVPVFLGLAVVFLSALLSHRLLGGGWIPAALLLAVVPASSFSTAFSNLDHHGLELLLFIAALGGVVLGGKSGALLSLGAFAVAFFSVPAWPVTVVTTLTAWGLSRGTPAFASAILGISAVTLPLCGIDVILHPQLRTVTEMMPLPIYMISHHAPFFPIHEVSAGVLLLPLAAWRWWPRRMEPASAAALSATAVTLPLAFLSIRFALYLSVPVAWATGEAWNWAGKRYASSTCYAVAVALILAPAVTALTCLSEDNDVVERSVDEALVHLRDASPPAGDLMDPLRHPSYGVASVWDIGFQIVVVGERPAVSTPMWWDGARRMPIGRIFFDRPNRGTEFADLIGARVLLFTPKMWAGSFAAVQWPQDGPSVDQALASRLYLFGDTGVGWRPFHFSDLQYPAPGRTVPAVQIWERDLDTTAMIRTPRSAASTPP